MSLFKKYTWYSSAVAVSALLAVALLLGGHADKASAVTTANNVTTAINLNTNSLNGTAAFTTLPAVVLTCGAGADITNAGDIVLNLTPGGAGEFSFTGGVAPTVTTTAGTSTVTSPATITDTDTITVVVSTADCSAGDTFTVTGIQVRPLTAGASNSIITADVAVTDPVAATITATNEFFQATTGSTAPTGTGNSVTTIVQSGAGAGFASVTFVATAGSFASNGSTTLFCVDAAACDTDATAGSISTPYVLPTSGTATVTSNPTGGAQDSFIITAQSATPGSASITRTPTVIPSTGGAGNGSAINVVIRNANGDAIAAPVTATTNLGVFEKNDATACDVNGDADGASAFASASCTYTSLVAGDTLTLYGNGASGTATITITAGNSTTGFSSTTATVTISGVAASIDLRFVRANTTSLTSKTSVRNTDSTGTDGQDELIVVALVKDASGNSVATGNVTFTLTVPGGSTLVFTAGADEQLTTAGSPCTGGAGLVCVDAVELVSGGSDVTPAAIGYIDVDNSSTSPEVKGVYSVKAETPGSTGVTVTATKTFEVVGAPATLTLPNPVPNVAVGSTQAVAITCKDADGKVCPSGTFVNISVSSATLIAQNPATGTSGSNLTSDVRTDDLGVATVNLIGVAQGPGQIVANTSTVTAVGSLTVTAAGTTAVPTGTAPPSGGTGQFDRPIPSVGVNTAIWGGGSVSQLAAATAAAGGISVTVFVNGAPVVLIPGAPDFVNAAFNAAFPAPGGVPAGTIVLVVK